MHATHREQSTPLDQLFDDPRSFEFYKAVLLLERNFLDKDSMLVNELNADLLSRPALYKFIKFKTISKNKFPVSAIDSINIEKNEAGAYTSIPEMFISFMGLTGLNGALPQHYTETLLYYAHHGDHALSDFFDIFNHRLTLLFYYAWKKNRYYVTYQSTSSRISDPFTNMLESFAGANSKSFLASLKIAREALVYYSGLFSGQVTSAMALEKMLMEYFELPIQILQFQGKWLSLEDAERSLIASKKSCLGQYQELGLTLMLGQKRFGISNHFRIYIGPLTFQQFSMIRLETKFLEAMVQMTQYYINAELSFDIQLELIAEEVPKLILKKENSACLGRNTWLISKPLQKNDHSVIIKIVN